jgi:hypothetical protein
MALGGDGQSFVDLQVSSLSLTGPDQDPLTSKSVTLIYGSK